MKITKHELKQIIKEEHNVLLEELEAVYNDPTYITKVLGISLHLNESGNYFLSESKKAQIIREHLLREGLIDSITTFVKDKTGPIKSFFESFKMVLSDRTGQVMGNFISLINSKIISPKLVNKQKTGLVDYIDKIINFINIYAATIIPTFKKFFEDLKNKINTLYKNLIGMPKNSWKTVLASAGLAVIISWIYEKAVEIFKSIFPNPLEDVKEEFKEKIITAIKDKLYGLLKQYSDKYIGEDLVNKLISLGTNISPFIQFLVGLVGSVDYISKVLLSATSRLTGLKINPTPT